ncbi:hypothetical protein [Polyangium fumosum]|uniref:Uncharacterized protein n=1 Tax=Polyangium fumosum TaxID=889272 RepID=A0A4V5PMH1_9BACT|nr:hypothetical protein [Polyangium fumosum]TKD03400.1 hypothetical protein E8A74_25895 [Polyangium fumosum]
MTPSEKAEKISATAGQVRTLCETLNRHEAFQCEEQSSCIQKEKARRFRGRLRPLQLFHPDRLCSPCRAYWFLSMASVELDSLERAALEQAKPIRGT